MAKLKRPRVIKNGRTVDPGDDDLEPGFREAYDLAKDLCKEMRPAAWSLADKAYPDGTNKDWQYSQRERRYLETLIKAVAANVFHVIVLARGKREALEKRVAELEAKTFADSYKGVFRGGPHKRGDVITSGGSLWLATRDTKGRPGDDSRDFRLIVKKGRDNSRHRDEEPAQ